MTRSNKEAWPSGRPPPRNPLAEFDELLNQVSGLLESTVGAAPAVAWTPHADVSESEDGDALQPQLFARFSEVQDLACGRLW
ncbi:hypothetical protein [Streptomyces sp. NPDC127190]|uniref:hypothetical protein n=1 Tax=unclassified Streptomyces TaxID=2593676 RepID=UPI0036365163